MENGIKLNVSKKVPLYVSGSILLNIRNEGILKDCTHPDKLKLADVSPVDKKENHSSAKNYMLVSVLPKVIKVFERLMESQLNEHISQFLLPFLCGYRF